MSAGRRWTPKGLQSLKPLHVMGCAISEAELILLEVIRDRYSGSLKLHINQWVIFLHKNLQYWKVRILEALENKSELNDVDFKADLSENNARLKEHINALAHCQGGGALVFGVNNKFESSDREINSEEIIAKVTNLAHATQEPPLNIEAHHVSTKLGKLSCLHILPPANLPVFIKDRSPLGGQACFKRTGSQTVPMSIEEIRNLLATSQLNSFDEGNVEGSTLSDLDFKKLEQAVRGFSAASGETKQNVASLIDSGVLAGTPSKYAVTVAGWLIFSRNPQIIRQFKNAFIEFQHFRGNTRAEPIKKNEIKGSLPDQIETTIDLLMQHMWIIPRIVGVKREELSSYDRSILREIITNAIVHRDYTKMRQPVKVALFTDRIEVENPGSLMPGLTELNLIHKRSWRNPLLAERLKVYGFGEMDGQGIDRLFAATHKIHLPAPIFSASNDSVKVVLSGPKKYEDYSPLEKRLTVIVTLILADKIDNESLRHTFNIDLQTAGTLIKSMVAEDIIEAVGKSRKYAQYRLTKQYQEKVFQ
jgi:ATP-dependent DNA helicase RecG